MKKPSKKAFTLLEILFVMVILLILMALLLPKIASFKGRSLRTSCAKNLKSLVNHMSLYASDYYGRFSGFTQASYTGAKADEVYGAMFESDGWNDLQSLVCPANSSGAAPIAAGYHNPLDMSETDARIDYWVVFGGNTIGNELSLVDPVGTNTIIIEKFSGSGDPGAFQNTDYHSSGGNAGYLNGKVDFISIPNFPTNEDTGGSSVSITKAKCSHYD